MSDTFDHEMDAYESAFDDGFEWENTRSYSRDVQEDVEVECTYIFDTKNALLLLIEGEECWVAKSQLIDWDDDIEYQKGEFLFIEIPDWLATKIGAI